VDLKYITIIDAIQYAVDKITKQEYRKDICPSKFIVSQADRFNDNGKVIDHEILLTITHIGIVRSRTLFPRIDCKYGYETLKDEMMWLYNSTM
jgi:hypothetical protein